jgi:hypothetical protein
VCASDDVEISEFALVVDFVPEFVMSDSSHQESEFVNLLGLRSIGGPIARIASSEKLKLKLESSDGS